MTLPPNLREKYLKRFDDLIQEGEQILASAQFGLVNGNLIYSDYATVYEWRQKSITLFEQFYRAETSHTGWVIRFSKSRADTLLVIEGLAHLRAMKDDLAHGFLDDLLAQIEAEVAGDYIGQAEQLLAEGQSGKFDHVPAAVLAGAVLEKSLRTLCDRQQPPITTTKPDGKPKTLDPLITDLKKAGRFNEAKAKQLQSWAAIRNHAAHGEFDKFTRSDVELMIKGITDFLGTYLG